MDCPATDANPEQLLRANELKQKLTKLITQLPERQADVFVLSQIEGFKNEQIANMLGCSANTVRVHLHRAVRRLADKLSDYLSQSATG